MPAISERRSDEERENISLDILFAAKENLWDQGKRREERGERREKRREERERERESERE